MFLRLPVIDFQVCNSLCSCSFLATVSELLVPSIFFPLFRSCRLSGFGVCFGFVPIFFSILVCWVVCVCLLAQTGRERKWSSEPETFSTGPLLSPEIVEIFWQLLESL